MSSTQLCSKCGPQQVTSNLSNGSGSNDEFEIVSSSEFGTKPSSNTFPSLSVQTVSHSDKARHQPFGHDNDRRYTEFATDTSHNNFSVPALDNNPLPNNVVPNQWIKNSKISKETVFVGSVHSVVCSTTPYPSTTSVMYVGLEIAQQSSCTL